MNMKKIVSIIVALCFFISIGAVTLSARTTEEEIAATKAYISSLEKKVDAAQKAKDAKRVASLKKLIAEQRVRLIKLEAKMAPPPPPPRPTYVPPPPPPLAPPAPPQPALEIGGSAGMVCSMLGALGELRMPDPTGIAGVLGIENASMRIALGYTQAENKVQAYKDQGWPAKFAPLYIDGLIPIPADWTGGLDAYAGGGLNYTLKTSQLGQTNIGFQLILGAQTDMFDGKVFGELNWGVLRWTPRPAYWGMGLTLGYRMPWII